MPDHMIHLNGDKFFRTKIKKRNNEKNIIILHYGYNGYKYVCAK